MRTKFDNDSLAVKQKNYLTKVVNVYIVYNLDNWPKIPLRNFALKNRLFCATTLVKHSDQEKWVYSGYEIVFDG